MVEGEFLPGSLLVHGAFEDQCGASLGAGAHDDVLVLSVEGKMRQFKAVEKQRPKWSVLLLSCLAYTVSL